MNIKGPHIRVYRRWAKRRSGEGCGEARGRTREAYSTSASAVREFPVNTGVYSAQYGRAAAAVINSVTTSGTNELHGSVYFFDRARLRSLLA
jgi:hypothetical protein